MAPDYIADKFLPWHRQMASYAHERGKLFFFHCCGKVDPLMDVLIDEVGIDAKHSFEENVVPVTEAKRRWGERVALLGGLDVDFIARSPIEAIRRRVRATLDICQPGGGYCLGLGNWVTDYIPVENYLAVLDEGRRDQSGISAETMMNSVERVHAALHLEQPDRVPVVEFVVDEKVARAAVPDCLDAADCMDRIGLDGVGCGARFEPVERASDGSYVDEWGVLYKPSQEVVAHPLRGPIRTIDQAPGLLAPRPRRAHRLGKLPELVKRYKGRRAIVFHHRAAFMWSAYLMDIDAILLNFLVDPETGRNRDGQGAGVQPADRPQRHPRRGGGDRARRRLRQQSRAHDEPRHVRAIHPAAALGHDRTDPPGRGAVHQALGRQSLSLLDMIVSAGPDGLNPIEPVAGMELRRVKELAGGRVCLCGNIDCGRLLPYGTELEVRQAVRQAIEDAAEGGGFILSSSNSIHSSCNARNFVAMVRACHEFGVYRSGP